MSYTKKNPSPSSQYTDTELFQAFDAGIADAHGPIVGPSWENAYSLGLVADSQAAAATNRSAINTALAAGKFVYVKGGQYYVDDPLVPASRTTLRGEERYKTNFIITSNTKTAVSVPASVLDLTLENFGVEAMGGYQSAVQNAGINVGSGFQNMSRLRMRNLHSMFFYYGVDSGGWWSSTMSDVIAYGCHVSLRMVGVGGSIQNTITNFYSADPRGGGMIIDGCHRHRFIGCNFGGYPSGASGFGIRVENNSFQIQFDGVNFEDIQMNAFNGASPTGGAAVIVGNGSSLTLRDASFVGNSGASASAYQAAIVGSGRLYMDDSMEYSSGLNIGSVAVYGTGAQLDTRRYGMVSQPTYQNSTNAGTSLKDFDGTSSIYEAPTVAGGWANLSGHIAGYRRDANGVVRLKGVVTGGTFSTTTVLFTLPSGYRPAETIDLPALNRNSSTNALTNAHIRIETDGDVVAYAGGTTGANAHLSLDNIRFQAA